jgi:Xaa-Pro aminopeptidase
VTADHGSPGSAERRERAIAHLADHGVTWTITRDLPTIRYFTGFSGSNAAMALGADGCVLVTDGRYRDQVADEVDGAEVVIERDLMGALASRLGDVSVALDPGLAIADCERLQQLGVVRAANVIDLRGVRAIKDRVELELLARACEITAQALMCEAAVIEVGDTEISIARRLEARFGALGAVDRSFPTIVATGVHAAIPHHQPTDAALAPGDLLVIDCGALVGGYHADMTRTFVVGEEPTERQSHLHDIVRRANTAGRAAAVPGVSARHVDEAARSIVAKADFGDYFTHGTGHGVGLEIHEPPMINGGNADTICAGTPITVEPGIYLPGEGGVRIEDTIVVDDPGLLLTRAPYDLAVVG